MTAQDRLKIARTQLGLNQTEFAKSLGITQTSLSMLESGKRPLQDRHIKVVCKTYGINENWLAYGTGEMFSSSPYLDEFSKIYSSLSDETQKHLLSIAQNLYDAEKKSK